MVVRQYNALFAELAERRAQAAQDSEVRGATRIQPNRGEPFADFRSFASHVLEPDLRLRLAPGMSAADLEGRLSVKLNRLYSGLRSSNAEALALLQSVEAAGPKGLQVQQLLANASPKRQPYLETTLVWLAKQGVLDWLP